MDAAMASLSPVANGVKSIEELGAVVAGVNDAPADGEAFPDAGPSNGATDGITWFPLSPVQLADQKARQAKYGLQQVAASSPSASDDQSAQPQPASSAPTASGRPRIYDASEGKKFDPLLNKTYDLSYAKVIPTTFRQ